MADPLHCTLTTPEERVFEGPARFVVVPASDGEMGILPRHAPLVGTLGFGTLRLDSEDTGKLLFFVDGGFLQVLDNHVSILAAVAVDADGLKRADEEERLRELEERKPASRASLEERDAYARSMAVAKARMRLAIK